MKMRDKSWDSCCFCALLLFSALGIPVALVAHLLRTRVGQDAPTLDSSAGIIRLGECEPEGTLDLSAPSPDCWIRRSPGKIDVVTGRTFREITGWEPGPPYYEPAEQAEEDR